MHPPNLVIIGDNEKQVELAVECVVDLFGSEMIKIQGMHELVAVRALMFLQEVIDHRIIKEMLKPFSLRTYGGSRPMLRLNAPPVLDHYEKLYFSDATRQELDAEGERQLTAKITHNIPQFVLLSKGQNAEVEVQLYRLQSLYSRNLLYTSAQEAQYAVYGIFCSARGEERRMIIQCLNKLGACLEPRPTENEAFRYLPRILPTTLTMLCLGDLELSAISSPSYLGVKAPKETFESEKVGPNLIAIITDDELACEVVEDLNNIDTRRIFVKEITVAGLIYVGVLYNSSLIKKDTLWYCLPKEIKRFIREEPMLFAPSLCSEDVFGELSFDEAEYDAIYSADGALVTRKYICDVGPRAIFRFSSQSDLIAFEKMLNDKFAASHIYIERFMVEVGYSFLSLLYDDWIVETNTLRSCIIKGTIYSLQSFPMSIPPWFVPDIIFEKLLFPRGVYKAITELGRFQQRYRLPQQPSTERKEEVELPVNPIMFFVDFEAYFYTKACEFPSEVAIVRVDNGKIQLSCQAFFNYPITWYDNLKPNYQSASDHVFRLTCIPLPHFPEYGELPHKVDATTLASLLIDIPTLSSAELVQRYGCEFSIDVFEHYDSEKDRNAVFCAKGIDLESLIFENVLGINIPIFEYIEVAKRCCRSEGSVFKDIHNEERQYSYCLFHQEHNRVDSKGKCTHCALDDSMYLANKFVANFCGWTHDNRDGGIGQRSASTEYIFTGDISLAKAVCRDMNKHGINAILEENKDGTLINFEQLIDNITVEAFCGSFVKPQNI